MKPALYVRCSSESARDAWRTRAGLHGDLEVIPIFPAPAAIELLRGICAERDEPLLIARDDTWIGAGMGRHLERLAEEMNRRFPNWAACGNRGVRWDDSELDFGTFRDEMGALTSVCAHPVISLDDNLLLINPLTVRSHKQRAPVVATPSFSVALSLECLANGSVMAASPRLMALRTRADQPPVAGKTEIDSDFQRYYRDHFVNHYYPAPGGGWDFSAAVDFSYVAEPRAESQQAGILDLFDRALLAAHAKPSLTICCRTQFRRPEMLERATLSFSVCRDNAALLSDLRIQLVTDQPAETAELELQRLARAHPSAGLECRAVDVREPRLSRIELLTAAIEQAQSDYIWFVDDDDYVNPVALPALARCLVPGCPLLVIAGSAQVNEQWDGSPETPNPSRKLKAAMHIEGRPARQVFAALRGSNPIPLCSMIFPVKLLQERLRGRTALGEYAEDYFLLLLALTAPRVEVRVLGVELATVSLRGLENTVGEADRSKWLQSYATFMLEVLNNQDGNSPFLWQQANMSPWDWKDS